MEYKDMNKILIKKFPSLQEKYLDEVSWQDGDDTGPHVVYGDVLNPYVSELLRSSSDSNEITKIFNFYEEMALSDDEEVQNLLQVTLLEYLWDEKIVYERAGKYMLPRTKEINSCIGGYLKKPQ